MFQTPATCRSWQLQTGRSHACSFLTRVYPCISLPQTTSRSRQPWRPLPTCTPASTRATTCPMRSPRVRAAGTGTHAPCWLASACGKRVCVLLARQPTCSQLALAELAPFTRGASARVCFLAAGRGDLAADALHVTMPGIDSQPQPVLLCLCRRLAAGQGGQAVAQEAGPQVRPWQEACPYSLLKLWQAATVALCHTARQRPYGAMERPVLPTSVGHTWLCNVPCIACCPHKLLPRLQPPIHPLHTPPTGSSDVPPSLPQAARTGEEAAAGAAAHPAHGGCRCRGARRGPQGRRL